MGVSGGSNARARVSEAGSDDTSPAFFTQICVPKFGKHWGIPLKATKAGEGGGSLFRVERRRRKGGELAPHGMAVCGALPKPVSRLDIAFIHRPYRLEAHGRQHIEEATAPNVVCRFKALSRQASPLIPPCRLCAIALEMKPSPPQLL